MRAVGVKDLARSAGAGLVAGVALTASAVASFGVFATTMALGAVLGGTGVYAVIGVVGRVGIDNGFASGWQVGRTMGRRSVRRSARVTRPSLANPAKVPIAECGIGLGRARRPLGCRSLYASHEDIVLAVGPPRMGKTGLLGNALIDAPGAVVTTSTKVDIHRLTAAVRSRRGPIYVLNPEAMAGVTSTFKWSPITGCDRPEIAIERAAYLIAGTPGTGGTQDQSFWDNSNAKVLRCYLYAAAVGGLTMADVRDWVNDPDDKEALRILEDHEGSPAGWSEALRQVLSTPADKTRESIYLTLQLTFEFMADPATSAAVLPGPGEGSFDLDRFLAERGALYLLGAHKTHGGMGPLFSALTGLVFEESKRRSQSEACPTGRLDPPLTMVLDEVANICPVPLAQWTSDAGGRGIPLVIAIQSPSQLRERWGTAAAETVWNNSNVTVVFGGLKVDGDLQGISGLCGERDELVRSHTRGAGGHSVSRAPRRIPVMAPSQIRQIRNGHVLVLHRNTRPVIAKVRPVWKRRDVRGVPDPQPIFGSALLGSLAALLARPVPTTAAPSAALGALDEDDGAVPVLTS